MTINPCAEKSSLWYSALYNGNKSHSGEKKKGKIQTRIVNFFCFFFEKPCVNVGLVSRRTLCSHFPPRGLPLAIDVGRRVCRRQRGEASWVVRTCIPTPRGFPVAACFTSTAVRRLPSVRARRESPGPKQSEWGRDAPLLVAVSFHVVYHLKMIIVLNPGLVPIA